MTLSATSRRQRWTVLSLVLALLGLQAAVGLPANANPFGDCAVPPAPENVGAGMTGTIDPPNRGGLAGSVYLQYSYAGQVWHVYDATDGMICSSPGADISTWVGNQLFSAGKVIVASANALHYMVAQGGLAWNLDQVIQDGAEATFDAFAGPFMALALLIVGIVVFWFVFRGDNAGAAKSGGRVALGVTLVAATAFSPLLYTSLFDNLLLDGVSAAQKEISEVMYPEHEDVVYRDVMPTTLHREVVYKNWLRGEFGSDEVPLADKLGKKLLSAQACDWSEVRSGDCDVEAKQDKFEKVAEKIEENGDYPTFTGESGSRVGIGALAFVESLIFGLLQIVAKLAVLLGQLVLRVFVLFGPIIGILAMAPGVGRTVARGVLGVGVLALLFNVVAGVHSFLLIRIMDTDLSLMAKLAIMTLITMLIWSVLRPVKRLKTMVASSMYTMPGQNLQRAGRWLQHSHMVRAMRKKRRSSKTPWYKREAGEGELPTWNWPNQGGDEDERPGSPIQASATVLRPEGAATSAPSALPAGTGARRGGAAASGTDAAGSPPPPPPRGPHGGNPSGAGTAVTPPPAATSAGTVRAESSRLWDADGTPHANHHESTSSSAVEGHRSHSAAQRDIQAAETPSRENAAPHQTGPELVTPSEVLSADDAAGARLRPATPQRDAGGGQTYMIFNPRTNQMETDSGETSTPPRPEQHNTGSARRDTDADSY